MMAPWIEWTEEDEDAANRAMESLAASGEDPDEGADPSEDIEGAWEAEDAAIDAFIAEQMRLYGDDASKDSEEESES